ncbi:hypothetical protein Ancab_024902 [Ancistrocladus abbreviatus]
MEEKHEDEKPPSRKNSLANIDVELLKKSSLVAADLVASPMAMMRKSPSTRSCLCSPTTHVGSFRCRLHRNAPNIRRGHSVGADLSELAAKYANKSTSLNKSILN